MNLETFSSILAWSLVFNLGFLVLWFLSFVFARDWMYRLHGRWFRLSPEQFDAAHYEGMARYKTGVILLNLAPYLAIRIAG